LKAIENFVDVYGKERKAGDEWLVDRSITDTHIIDAQEQLITEKKIIILSSN